MFPSKKRQDDNDFNIIARSEELSEHSILQWPIATDYFNVDMLPFNVDIK